MKPRPLTPAAKAHLLRAREGLREIKDFAPRDEYSIWEDFLFNDPKPHWLLIDHLKRCGGVVARLRLQHGLRTKKPFKCQSFGNPVI
jgi:hypothetical protein